MKAIEAGFRAVEGLVMEGPHDGVLDGAVHWRGLAVGPRVIGLAELVGDVLLAADASEGVQTALRCRTRAVAGPIGKGDAVAGQSVRSL